jgi:hypothetical protein
MASQKPQTIPAAFKLSLLVATGLTLVSLLVVIGVCLLNAGSPTMAAIPESQRQLYNTCSFCWQSGFGCILGLIGGKMTGSDSAAA